MAKWNRTGTYYVYNADNDKYLGCGSRFTIGNYFGMSKDIIDAHVRKGTAFPVLKYKINLRIEYKEGIVEDEPLTVRLERRDSKYFNAINKSVKPCNMVEVFKIFRRPRNKKEMEEMRNHFSIINLNRVRVELDGKSFEDGFPYRINFRMRDKTRAIVFTEHFYDKELAEERLKYLKKFKAKKKDGDFWYDGNKYDISRIICIDRTRSKKISINCADCEVTKKTRYDKYLDLARYVQEEFIR